MAPVSPEDPLTALEKRLGAEWTHLRNARTMSAAKRREISEGTAGLDSEDTSIVVSGSLARDEFTAGSDIDWTLLIDGSADPKHYDLFRKIGSVIDALSPKRPGPEGTFGKMVFSHALIHEIGGEEDTNRNTTRRLLLLLESRAVRRDDAYTRVVRGILDRYLLEDRGLWKGSSGHRVPRFLQNDFARFWRTMAVDFAYKLRNRAGDGWAIRNIKLRMSRKLLYISGLLACYRCHLDYDKSERSRVYGEPRARNEVIEHLQAIFRETPLENVAGVLLRYPHLDDSARKILGSYNEFVGMLADDHHRNHLDKLRESDADDDTTFQKARGFSHDFRDGVLELFFDEDSGMCDLTKTYGVF
jgi:predicted nucleotidyltransferase